MKTYFLEPQFGEVAAWERAWKPISEIIREACEESGFEFHEKGEVKFLAHASKKTAPWGSFFYKENHLRSLYSIDRNGWGMTHSGLFGKEWEAVDPVLARKFCEQQAKKFLENGHSNQPQPPVGKTEFPDGNYILATLQMPGDSVIVQNSGVTVEQFVELLADFGPDVVVKNHPGNIPERFQELNRRLDELVEQKKIKMVSGNIHDLISRSMGVITINSGTGFEALLHGKPVALFGNADYQEHCLKSQSFHEIEKYFSEYTEGHCQRAYQFVWDYCFRHCFWLFGDPNGAGRAKRFVMEKLKKWHLGGHCNVTHIDEGVLRYFKEVHHVSSMLDIGCGPTGMKDVADKLNIQYLGIDGDPDLPFQMRVMIHDFTLQRPDYLYPFSLAWSVEFLEHLEEKFLPNVIPVFRGCDWVVITHAPPGHGGHHHVNLQPSSYWIKFFEGIGFEYRPEDTATVRKVSTMKRNFMRETGLVFRKK